MKKITLTLGLCLAAVMSFGQAFFTFNAPVSNGGSTQLRAPNGTSTHASLRGVFHITAAEMAVSSPTSAISSFGFNYLNGVTGAPVTGSIVVYFVHTADVSNLKGAQSWATIITGMTTVYSNSMVIPAVATATTLDLPLSSVFSYTGGNFYVAYDYVSNGPYSTAAATYDANSAIAGSGATGASSVTTTPATLLGATAFRPAFRFGAPNNISNDISVESITTPATLPVVNGTGHGVMAQIRNNSNVALTNIAVGVVISGAVTFSNGVIVPSLGAGSTTMVTFPNFPYTPALTGVNSISVSVLPDQVNTNNLRVVTQTVNCNNQANGPDVTATTFSNGIGFNTGSGFLANRMRFDGNGSVSGVNIAISTGTAIGGNATYAAIINSAGTVIATSNTITLVPANYGTYTSYTFAAPVPVTSGADWYIGLAQTANTVTGYFPVASNNTAGLIVPANTLYSIPLVGGAPVAQSSGLGFLGIKAILQGTCGTIGLTEINNNKPVTMALYPNPATTNLTVELANVSENATLDIFNTLGQKVTSVKNLQDSNTINVSSLTSGVYFVTVTNGKQKATQKLVIEK